jgi:hypothetical protein
VERHVCVTGCVVMNVISCRHFVPCLPDAVRARINGFVIERVAEPGHCREVPTGPLFVQAVVAAVLAHRVDHGFAFDEDQTHRLPVERVWGHGG